MRWTIVSLVTVVHLGLLAWAASWIDRFSRPQLPVINGMLIAAPAAIETPPQALPMAPAPTPVPYEPVQRPQPTVPARMPSVLPKLRPQLVPQPMPQPMRVATLTPTLTTLASDRSIAVALPAPAVPAAPVQPPPTVAPASAPAPAPASAKVLPDLSAPVAAPADAAAPPVKQQDVVAPRSDAAHLNNPPPNYPPVSRRLGEAGQVVLEVHIQPDGSVGEMRVKRSSGFERLDEAALRAVRKWRYVPARRGDQPIAWWYLQPIVFSIDS